MVTSDLISPYFTQTQAWADFWLEAADVANIAYTNSAQSNTAANTNKQNHQKSHQVHVVEVEGEKTFIYEYPWYFGRNFLYVPSALYTVNENISVNSQKWTQIASEIKKIAANRKSVFIKLELDPHVSDILEISSAKTGVQFVKDIFASSAVLARKRIMYGATSLLDCSELNLLDYQPAAASSPLDFLKVFFEGNSGFWGQINSGHRAKTRKSLTQNWDWSEEKSAANFEHFWSIYSATAGRQSFTTQPKSYFETLYAKPESRIVILFDQQNKQQPQAAWFGYSYNNSLVYLYGGNTAYSMEHFGQYLIHLIALKIAKQEKNSVYDLGGYDPKEGYGVFKERYKGKIVNFYGPYDIILKPLRYRLTESLISGYKLIKARKHYIVPKK